APVVPDVLECLIKWLDQVRIVVVAARWAKTRGTGFAARRPLVLGHASPSGGEDPSEPPDPSVLSLDDVRGHGPPPPRRPRADDPLVILPTSGTTGVPKLVAHSTRTLLRRLAAFEAQRWPVLGSRPDDVV